jgi:hypothetical protein
MPLEKHLARKRGDRGDQVRFAITQETGLLGGVPLGLVRADTFERLAVASDGTTCPAVPPPARSTRTVTASLSVYTS